ncbi:hypothetical protein IFM89_010417 [Coptis chinensis]|uniref:F-box domain-containing protein n=1 Tax=Coptis chinensis TaxID=261450 RepID=A0A835LER2_9MAGN|nr:hypothetical protein IFM89_010417 [Coptis chinensis]
MATCFDMPEDVMFRILLCLPVMSLMRFKSVCMSWRNLIESSGFIAQHIHYRENCEGNLIVFNPCVMVDDYHFGVYVSLFLDDNFKEPAKLDLPYYCAHAHGSKYIDYYDGDNFYIRSLSLVASYPPNGRISLGFGFDVKTNDYKVVRIILGGGDFEFCLVQVYSLSTNTWRIVDTVLPLSCGLIVSQPKAPLQNGTYCWLVRFPYESQNFCDSILSFDFSDEVFRDVPLPDVCSIKSDGRLAILRENLACISRIFTADSETYLTDDTVGPFSWCWPMGFSKNEESILLGNSQGLFSCDPHTEELINIPVEGSFKQGSKDQEQHCSSRDQEQAGKTIMESCRTLCVGLIMFPFGTLYEQEIDRVFGTFVKKLSFSKCSTLPVPLRSLADTIETVFQSIKQFA